MTRTGSSYSDWEPTSKRLWPDSPVRHRGQESSPTLLHALLTLFLLSCAGVRSTAIPTQAKSTERPEETGDSAWTRLARLGSFAFDLRFHTSTPFSMTARFTGARDSCDREVWTGTIRRGNEVSRVELRAEDAVQYEKDGPRWRRTLRGIETRVLEQGAAVLRGRPLLFSGSERGRHVFRFTPDLPLLDPGRTKSFTGWLEVEPRSGLPLRLYCQDSARTAEWELRLRRFNRGGSVAIPFLPAMVVEGKPSRRLSRSESNATIEILRQRLKLLGWECRLRRNRGRFVLLLSQPKPRKQLELLASPGTIEVWQAERLVQDAGHTPDAESLRVLEMEGDASRRFALVARLGANEQLAVEVKAETPLSAALQASLPHADPGVWLVLVVNGKALSSAHATQAGTASFGDLGNEDDARLYAALAAGPRLPAELNVTVRP